MQPWASYWKNVAEDQEQFIEAATRGDLPQLKRLLEVDGSRIPIDVNYKSFDDWTALHYATLHSHYECAEFLLKHSADANQKSKFGWTPLHISAKHNELKIAQLLIDANC